MDSDSPIEYWGAEGGDGSSSLFHEGPVVEDWGPESPDWPPVTTEPVP